MSQSEVTSFGGSLGISVFLKKNVEVWLPSLQCVESGVGIQVLIIITMYQFRGVLNITIPEITSL